MQEASIEHAHDWTCVFTDHPVLTIVAGIVVVAAILLTIASNKRTRG